ncbi:MAG: hypothetical protein ABIP21_11090 [Acidimicrobiia bacterium]
MARDQDTELEESTPALYAYLLRCHIVPRFGATPVGRPTAVDVKARLADLHRTNLSESTAAKPYRLLKGLMDSGLRVAKLDPIADVQRRTAERPSSFGFG